MSYQLYPSYGLPLPRETYQLQEESSVVRTKFESGRARQRRRYAHNLKLFQVRWRFTREEFLLWRMFVIEGINNGADYFQMELLIDDVLDTKTVRLVNGDYNVARADDVFDVSATIEIENMELSSYPGIFSLYEVLAPDFDGGEALTRIDLLNTLVHETLTENQVV